MRRSRLEICIDILKAVEDGKTKFTRVMYESNTSWQILQENVQFLMKNGLIQTKQNGKRKAYLLTEEGHKIISDFKKIERAIPLLA